METSKLCLLVRLVHYIIAMKRAEGQAKEFPKVKKGRGGSNGIDSSIFTCNLLAVR